MGPVCFDRSPAPASAFEVNSVCQLAASIGRGLALDCFRAARLLEALPSVPPDFNIYSGWSNYRLADVVRWGLEMDSYHDTYPGSIAAQYVSEQQTCCANYELLRRIVNSRDQEQPATSTLVIQVRAGDVIDNDNHSVLELLTFQLPYARYCGTPLPKRPTFWQQWADPPTPPHGSSRLNWCEYVRPLRYYIELLKSLPGAVERIELVSGSHWPLSKDGITHLFDDEANSGSLASFSKSWQYLHTLQAALWELGYPTTLRLGRTPDDDVAYISRAQFFLPSGGGFSRLLAKLVRLNGGHVICPKFTGGSSRVNFPFQKQNGERGVTNEDLDEHVC